MPRISDAERRTSMQSAERLRIDARLKRIEAQKARLVGRDTYAGHLSFQADELDRKADEVIANVEQYESDTRPPPAPPDDKPPRPSLDGRHDGTKLVADELARQQARDDARGTEPTMLPKLAIPPASQRANDALKQVTMIGAGGRTSGPGIRTEV